MEYKKYLIKLLVMFLIFINTPTFSMSLSERDIYELSEQSELVVIGRVISRDLLKYRDVICGYIYRINVATYFKSELDDSIIEVGYKLGLDIGEDYLLYIGKISRSDVVTLHGMPSECILHTVLPDYYY
ncbi:hypothetical protein, partial [Thiolapillus sp.]